MAKFGVEDVLFLDEIAASGPEEAHRRWAEYERRYRQLLGRIESPADFADAVAVLDDCRGGMLVSFGGWLAMHAVQNHATDEIRLGLVANALDYMVTKDWRDHLYCLARLSRACELLDRDIADEFLRAAEIVGPTVGHYGKADDWLLSFASRTPTSRSLASFGEVEEGSGATFRFRSIGELFTELVQVIPVIQRQVSSDAAILLVSIERYSDGFLVLFRFEKVPGKTSLGQLRYPWNAAIDDQGRTYIASTSGSGPTLLGADVKARREAVLFTPALPSNARWIRIELPVVQRIDWIREGSATTGVRYTNLLSGPWVFTVPIPPRN